MAIEGFELARKGKASGLVWVNFKNIQVHGVRGTVEFEYGMRQKAALIDKVLLTEFQLGTRHLNRSLKQLMSPKEVIESYVLEGGFFVELTKDRNVRAKLEGLDTIYGIEEHPA